jgi:hypothetical protein
MLQARRYNNYSRKKKPTHRKYRNEKEGWLGTISFYPNPRHANHTNNLTFLADPSYLILPSTSMA